MADSEPVDTTQQVTSKAPTTKQKNPKQAREAQKKALAEAQIIKGQQTPYGL